MYRPVTPCSMSKLNLEASTVTFCLALTKAQTAIGQALGILGTDLAVFEISSRLIDVSIQLASISNDFFNLVNSSDHD